MIELPSGVFGEWLGSAVGCSDGGGGEGGGGEVAIQPSNRMENYRVCCRSGYG